MLGWQVPVQTTADVLQQHSQPEGQVGLPVEQRKHSAEPEERHLSPPLRQPATKGRSSDPFQAVKVPGTQGANSLGDTIKKKAIEVSKTVPIGCKCSFAKQKTLSHR